MEKVYVQTFKTKQSVERISAIERLLKMKPLTTTNLATQLCASPKTAQVYLNLLRSQIHAAAWHACPHGGRPAPLWAWGGGPDAPCLLVGGKVSKREEVKAWAKLCAAPKDVPPRIEKLVASSLARPHMHSCRDYTVAMLFGPKSAAYSEESTCL